VDDSQPSGQELVVEGKGPQRVPQPGDEPAALRHVYVWHLRTQATLWRSGSTDWLLIDHISTRAKSFFLPIRKSFPCDTVVFNKCRLLLFSDGALLFAEGALLLADGALLLSLYA